MAQGVHPKVFKKSLIDPVHEGGPRYNGTIYRPISVLTSSSKSLEKIPKATCKLLTTCYPINSQFGFRTEKCTEDAVIMLLFKWMLEEGVFIKPF